MVLIEKHRAVLARLGLSTLDDFKNFKGEVVQPNRREVLRIRTQDEAGRELVLFLKRNWKIGKKNGLHSLLRRGRVWSAARLEWENMKTMQQAGFHTAALVAYADDCGPLWEKFSCLLTEAAIGPDDLETFLTQPRSPQERRRVFDALAVEARHMHAAGVATPDFYTRHIFFDAAADQPRFCFIDLTRLDQGQPLSMRACVRALASLNVSAPLRLVTVRERLRFLRIYAGQIDARWIALIQERTGRLLARKKYPDYLKGRTP